MPATSLFDIFGAATSLKDAIKEAAVSVEPPTEEAVRERAYLLWEEAGRPEGDGVDFWVRAEQELSGI